MASVAKPKSRFRLRSVVILGLLAFACALLMAVLVYRSQAQQDMESLAQFVLDTGSDTFVPESALAYFGLPTDEFIFRQLKAVSQSGRTRAIQVRRLSSGDVEIFLLDLLPNSAAGYFYLTGTHGRLVNAAYFNEKPEAIEEARERFQHELGFWLKWQREKLKRAE